MRIGWSIPLPGPFRISGTLWRSKPRRRRRKTWHGQLSGGWRCHHKHSRPDLATECARRELRRRGIR